MSDREAVPNETFGHTDAGREAAIAAFEAAWLGGHRPRIADFLPPDGESDPTLLAELAHADLECRLKAGEPARVEDYLTVWPALASAHNVTLGLIEAEYQLRRRRENELSLAEFSRRFPQFAGALEARLASGRINEGHGFAGRNSATIASQLDATGELVPGAEPVTTDPYRTIPAAPPPDELVHVGAAYPFLTPPEGPGELGRLGGYRVVKLLGAGGMGMVFEAEDIKLKRRIALKVMKPELAAYAPWRQRFLREAQTVAALEHDNVVAIFQVGEDRGWPFLAMPYLQGESLYERLRRERKLPVDDALRIGREVADGLAAAHALGLVHRDIKPGNIWLDAGHAGRRAKILDFGLARADEGDEDLTQTGAVLGTPAYMAPEQRIDSRQADARSDIWSLAATLYQLVSGSAPRVIRAESVPEALRPVLLKALSDEPTQRYATAKEFSHALTMVEGELERSAPAPEQADAGRCPKCLTANDPSRKFCQRCGESLREPCPRCRQPIVVGAAYCGECGANVAAVISELKIHYDGEKLRVESLLDDFRHPEAITQLELMVAGNLPRLGEYADWAASTLESVRGEYQRLKEQRRQLLEAANGRCAVHEYQAAVRLLEQIPAKFRDEQARALHSDAEEQWKKLQVLAEEIRQAQQTKQMEGLLAKVERFLKLKPGDRQAGELLARLYSRQCIEVRRFEGGYAAATTCLALFDDGRRLLLGGVDGLMRIADLQSGREMRRFIGHEGPLRSVGVAPDQQTLLSAGYDGTLRFWRAADGSELRRCDGHRSALACAAFSLDGRFALSGGADRTLRVWDVVTGRELRSCEGHESTVVCVAPMRDVPCALSGGADGALRLWNVRTARQIQVFLGHKAPVLSVAISADGRHALSASGSDTDGCDDHLRLWSIHTGAQVCTFAGAPQSRAVALTPDGRYALSGGRDATLRLWRLPAGNETHRYEGHDGEIVAVAISPDGRFAVTASNDRSVRVWRLPR